MRRLRRRHIIPVLLLSQACLLTAGETGKIAGRVVDGVTQEPLMGANVLVSAIWIEDEEVDSYILDQLYGKDSHETGYNTYRENITAHT